MSAFAMSNKIDQIVKFLRILRTNTDRINRKNKDFHSFTELRFSVRVRQYDGNIDF